MYREEGKKKSIIISATGTGKTLISAFDVKNMQPKKMLFVVHRQKIAKKSLETFKKIIPSGEGISFGMYSGDTMDSHADYLFSTVQTRFR